jgi:SRP-independent targeting protein 2/TMEM208
LYILTTLYVYLYKPAGPIYDSEGTVVGESYGVTNWDIYGLILFSIVSYFFYGLVKNCLENGLTPGYTLDVFAINLLSQFILCFTRYGWYIYMIVPGYLGWKATGFIWQYLASKSDQARIPEEKKVIDPKEAKKMAKMERKEQKGQRVKYVRA